MSNVTFVIFGATGDLAKRKLIPALCQLIAHKKVREFAIIGVAIDDIDAPTMLMRARDFIEHIDDEVWQQILARSYYQRVNFEQKNDFEALSLVVQDIEKKHMLSGNRICYFAAAAYYFCTLTQQIAQARIVNKQASENPWHRIVYEKPFGHDVQSAHEINACIAKYFNEQQIYRIDHYLTKELVSNLALMRFTNCVFEPLWNNRYIDHIQIILSEYIGLEGRGAYYDVYGALCDVVQNHVLSLLSLVCMESPAKLTGDAIRAERIKVLQKVRIIDGILGQFDGYTKERGVKPDSKTETFASLCVTVDNPRWSGIPIFIKTGKCLEKKETAIHIKFKQVDCVLTRNCPPDSNWLSIKIDPDATFLLHLNVKKPGTSDDLVPIAMEFCHSCLFEPRKTEAYEILLEEIIKGEQSVSVRFDEIEYAWKIIGAIHARHFPVYGYACASSGPKEDALFEQKYGMQWRL